MCEQQRRMRARSLVTVPLKAHQSCDLDERFDCRTTIRFFRLTLFTLTVRSYSSCLSPLSVSALISLSCLFISSIRLSAHLPQPAASSPQAPCLTASSQVSSAVANQQPMRSRRSRRSAVVASCRHGWWRAADRRHALPAASVAR